MTATTEDRAAMQLGGPLAEFLEQQIPIIARASHGRYRNIPADDYGQALWLEALSKPHRFRIPFDRGDLALVKRRLYQAATDLRNEDDRFRRAQSAAEAGYSIDDIAFYSTGLLGLLLPVMVASDMDVADAMQRAGSSVDAVGVYIRTNDPFSGAENYLVMLTDIKAAWGRLTEGQRRLLTAYYGCDQEDTDNGRWERDGLAASMGLTGNALRVRVHRALERLQDELGGADPWRH